MAGNVIRYTLNIKLSITFLIRKEKQIITVILALPITVGGLSLSLVFFFSTKVWLLISTHTHTHTIDRESNSKKHLFKMKRDA